METVGKPIQCKAAIAWEANKPLEVTTVTVDPPGAGEVRTPVVEGSHWTRASRWLAGRGALCVQFMIVLLCSMMHGR